MKKEIKKKLILSLIALFVIGLLGLLYINLTLLPVKIKNFVIKKAEELFQRKVSIGEIQVVPIKGITMRDVVISGKDPGDPKLLSLKELNFNILLLPILKDKHIIIPSIRIMDPDISLSRLDEGTWNFSDLIKSKTSTTTKNPYSVLLRKIVLENGKIDLF